MKSSLTPFSCVFFSRRKSRMCRTMPLERKWHAFTWRLRTSANCRHGKWKLWSDQRETKMSKTVHHLRSEENQVLRCKTRLCKTKTYITSFKGQLLKYTTCTREMHRLAHSCVRRLTYRLLVVVLLGSECWVLWDKNWAMYLQKALSIQAFHMQTLADYGMIFISVQWVWCHAKIYRYMHTMCL